MDYLTISLLIYSGLTTIPLVLFIKDLIKSKDAKELDYRFIRDLSTRGRTIIKVERVDPNETFIRSPKDIM